MASVETFKENGLAAMIRGNVYELLSRLLSGEADRGLVEWLCSEDAASALVSLGVDASRMVPCPAQGAAKGEEEDGLEGFLNALAEEYTGLFVVPGGVSPYASVRIKGQLCHEPEWHVRKFYKDCGLVMNEERKIFADHIGAELGFMGYLAGKEHSSWEEGKSDEALKWHGLQAEFFNAHLSVWAFDFLDDVGKAAGHDFYREAAVLARRFLELEQEELVQPAGR